MKAPTVRPSNGFTLVELLIVMTIFALLTATVVITATGAAGRQQDEGFALTLARKIELARQEALQRNREWGLYIDSDRYVFAEYDDANTRWVELTQRPFEQVDVRDSLDVSVDAEGFTQKVLEDKKAGLPQVVVFSSGEQTPFSIRLTPHDGEPWLIESDGLSQTRVSRED